jgi:RHS repeat-associated protein
MHPRRSLWQTLLPLWMFLVSAFMQSCSCQSTKPVRTKASVCVPQHKTQTVSTLSEKKIVPGATAYSFGVDGSGQLALSIPLQVPTAQMVPELELHYAGPNHDGVAGNFDLVGASVISRCNKSLAIDGENCAVQMDSSDALCLDGNRLVVTEQNAETVEYRLWPDNQVKVMQHVNDTDSSFVAFHPNGEVIEYGTSEATRPSANGVVYAWLAAEQRDPRGNVQFGYCFAEEDGNVQEFALDEISYADRVVSLAYSARENARVVYENSLPLQRSLQLDSVRMAVGGKLTHQYDLTYEQSETTKRSLLASIEECAGTGECKAPTRFEYADVRTGFDEVATNIGMPLSDKASPLPGDFTGDGRMDWLSPDTLPISTATNPITEWRITTNTANGFASEKQAFLQEWPIGESEGPSDPTQIQPELGALLDYNADGRSDILLHDVTGTRNNFIVLLAQADGTFQALDTGIQRPFPLGPAPKGLRSELGAVHLADVTGDSVVDLIQCSNQDTGVLASWKLHIWEPGGFQAQGVSISTLDGIPCSVEMQTVDTNNDSVTDLVFPGYLRQGNVVTEPSGHYSVTPRRTNGEWEIFDLGLRTPLGNGRTLFVDVNGDALPDAVQNGSPDGRLYTYLNTGRGFVKTPQSSLPSDGSLPQTTFFHLSIAGDFNGDGRMDLLMPLIDAISPDVPRWVILQATDDEFTFERIESGIPFAAQLDETVRYADPRIPRVADVNNDGADDVLVYLDERLTIFQNRAVDPDVLVGISDGNNDHDPDDPEFVPNVEITYAHLQENTELYESRDDVANGCVYPRHCVVAPQRVVREYAVNDGAGGQRRYGLQYRDGRYDRLTQQFLGFGKRILTDLDTGETTIDVYDNVTKQKIGEREVYPFLGQIVKQWQYAPGLPTQPNPDLVEMTFAEKTLQVVPTNNAQSYFTLATKTRTRRLQGLHTGPETLEAFVTNVEALNSATMLRDSTVNVLDWDEFRNVLDVQVSTKGVDTTLRITRSVKNDVANWRIGLPDAQTECSNGAGIELCRTIKRTTNAFGEVETEATSSKDGLKDTRLDVRYERDKYGNVTKTLADDGYGNHREETTEYDAAGIFPTKRINALRHETLVEYDPALGVLRKEADVNGLVTEWTHDGFGRVISEKRPDGSNTTITRTRERIGGVWRTRLRTTTTGGADDEVITDSLGRTTTTLTFGPTPNGETTRVKQIYEYDRLSGEVVRLSIPTSETTPANALQWHAYEYDALGRVVRHETPWGAITTTKYDGLTTEVTIVGAIGEMPQVSKTATDALGRPITMTDANGGITRHTYGPFDTLRTITDPGSDVMTWTRDAFGRPTKLEDPNRGTTTFSHDGFGNLVASADALGRTATYTRDALGRLETRTDTHLGKTLTTTWTWDTAANGKGKLHSLTSPDAVKTYSYTAKGQLERLMLTTNADSFAATWTYDEFGRSKTLTYPQPIGDQPFTLTRDYDAHGYVVGVRDAATTYWELTAVDDAGRYKTEQLGNGLKTTRSYDQAKQTLKSISTMLGGSTIQQLAYDYDGLLNLKKRTDTLQAQNKTERFRYDKLNRLTCAYFATNENPGAACAQSFAYAANGNLLNKSDVGTLLYNDAKHPHAVTNNQGDKYDYDVVGNQITRPGGVSITYTPFDLPSRITQGADVTTFGYDGDEQRIRKTTPNSETLYFEELFEQVSAGNTKAYRYYVHSPERVIAVVTHGGDDPGTKWLSVDNLGSVESVTDENGKVVEKRSYDAFGAKRNPVWGMAGGPSTAKTTKGFTGHEEDEEFGLINARGRLYDPRIARFTTPDPIIASIYDGQSLNSFSYVWNNPLSFIDPSGFIPQEPTMNGQDSHAITPEEFVYSVLSSLQDETQSDTNAVGIGAAASTTDTATTGASGAITKSQEGFGSFVDGLVKGNLSDNDSWSATLGSVVGGLIPGVGLVADIRDLGAAVGHIAEGKEGAWLELGASVIGFVPGGDIAKGIAKGVTKATTKTAAKVGVELMDDAAKVLKGSTATAADGLTSAQKTAGKVNAPRGPPNGAQSTNPRTATRAQRNAALERAKGPDGIEKCTYCDRPLRKESGHSNSVEIDHRKPYVKGGPTIDTNLDATCRTCNRSKGSKKLGSEWVPPKDR